MSATTNWWDAVHDSRDAFSSVLWAMCNPGRSHGPLPRAGLEADPAADAAAGVLLALLDPGVGLADDGRPGSRALAEGVRAMTAASVAPVEDADFVVSMGRPDELDAPLVARARRGNRFQPEQGATVVYVGTGVGTSVELRGPGIDGSVVVDVGLDGRELAARADANADGLLGVDVVIVRDDGTVVALPRTTRCSIVGSG